MMGCATTKSKEIVENVQGAAYFLFLIPVAIVTSPYWGPILIAEKIKGEPGPNSKNEKQRVWAKIYLGLSRDEIKRLLNEPEQVYFCHEPYYEVWEYSYDILNSRTRFFAFDEYDSLSLFANTYRITSDCSAK